MTKISSIYLYYDICTHIDRCMTKYVMIFLICGIIGISYYYSIHNNNNNDNEELFNKIDTLTDTIKSEYIEKQNT